MADTKEFTKAKLKVVTSATTASRHPSIAMQNTADGAKPPTHERDAQKIADLLARLIDVTHNWPCKTANGKMPAPLIANGHIIIALPDGGHVIKNAITSEGGQNFMVDGMLVIPVTSEAK